MSTDNDTDSTDVCDWAAALASLRLAQYHLTRASLDLGGAYAEASDEPSRRMTAMAIAVALAPVTKVIGLVELEVELDEFEQRIAAL